MLSFAPAGERSPSRRHFGARIAVPANEEKPEAEVELPVPACLESEVR
jgi:hypothetical protein